MIYQKVLTGSIYRIGAVPTLRKKELFKKNSFFYENWRLINRSERIFLVSITWIDRYDLIQESQQAQVRLVEVIY